MKVTKNFETAEIKLEFGDAGTIEFSLGEFPEEIQEKLAVYGAVAKVSRATAGKASDDLKAYEAAKAVVDALKEGKWNIAKVSTTETKRQFILDSIAVAPKDQKKAMKAAFEAAGILEKLGITEADLKKVM